MALKRGLFICDTHYAYGEPAHWSSQLIDKIIQEDHFDFLVHGGDFLDWAFLATFNKDNLKMLAGGNFRDEFDLANARLDFYQKHIKKIFLLAGNHDERLYRHIEREPSLDGLVDYETQLRPDSRGITFLRQVDQPLKIGKLHFVHGYFSNKWMSNSHLTTFMHNIIFGHCHRFQTFSAVLPIHPMEIQSWGIGCLCDKNPDWLDGKPSQWQTGCADLWIQEDGSFQVVPVNLIDKRCIMNGRLWKLGGK